MHAGCGNPDRTNGYKFGVDYGVRHCSQIEGPRFGPLLGDFDTAYINVKDGYCQDFTRFLFISSQTRIMALHYTIFFKRKLLLVVSIK